jgi:3D (Asp-Asp-Asp) domain-containing protein
MSPEIKNTAHRITTKEKIARPLAAIAITGAAMFSVQKDRAGAQIDNHIVPSGHELTLKDNIFSHAEFDILSAEQVATLPQQGPQPPTQEEIENEITELFSKAAADGERAEQARLAHEAQLAEDARIAALNRKNTQQVAPPPAENVSAAASEATPPSSSTKLITGYYCEYDNGYYGDGGGFCGHMANGVNTHAGAAACGPSYPLGTVFNIEGYGEVTCEDRGGGIGDDHIDVFTYYSSGLAAIPTGTREVSQVK